MHTLNADERAIYLLQQMVEIESLSGHEAALAQFLCEQMRLLGLRAFVDNAGNAVGEIGAHNAPCTVVLLGHMDTVPGHIPVCIEEGQLYGRGTVDAKGPLATFICAAAMAGALPDLRVVVIGAVEEEAATSKGARYASARYHPDYCVIGEPSAWDRITLGYKGRLLVDYTARQAIGHTAGPQGGIAEAAVAWWLVLQRYAGQANEGITAVFDQIQPSLRRINTRSDGLYEQVDMTVGIRLPPGCDVEALRTAMREAAGDAMLQDYGEEEAFRGDKNNPLCRAFLAAIRGSGGNPAFKVKTGTSDMNVVGPAWACPIVAYGPGDSSLDHTPNEHIDLGEYLKAIGVLADVLRALAGS